MQKNDNNNTWECNRIQEMYKHSASIDKDDFAFKIQPTPFLKHVMC